MKIQFKSEDEIVLEGENIFIPANDDLLHIDTNFYRVKYKHIDYDKDICVIRLRTLNKE